MVIQNNSIIILRWISPLDFIFRAIFENRLRFHSYTVFRFPRCFYERLSLKRSRIPTFQNRLYFTSVCHKKDRTITSVNESQGKHLRRIWRLTGWSVKSEVFKGFQSFSKEIPSLKLTWPLKIDPWKRRFLLETTIFRCYVSFREGIAFNLNFQALQIQVWSTCCDMPGGRFIFLHNLTTWWRKNHPFETC